MAVNNGDVLEMTVKHSHDVAGQQLNRYQFELDVAAPADEADVLDDIAIIMQTLYLIVESIISIRNIFIDVGVFNVTQDTLLGATLAGTYDGGVSNDPALPSGIAAYIHFVTNIPRVILSKYLPAGSTNDLNVGGHWSPSVTAILTAFGTELASTQTFGLREYNYGYLSPKTSTFVLPQVLVVRNTPAYQRRRKAGVGS